MRAHSSRDPLADQACFLRLSPAHIQKPGHPFIPRLDHSFIPFINDRYHKSKLKLELFAMFGPHMERTSVRGAGLPYRDSSSPPFCVTSIALFVRPTLFTTPPKEQQMRFFGQGLETICTAHRCTFWATSNERVLHERRHINGPF